MNCTGPSSTECSACAVDYGLVNNTCSICPNGTTSDGLHPCQNCSTPNCLACSDSDICEACVSPYELINSTSGVPECAQPCNIPNCNLCVEANACAVCKTNYTVNAQGGCTLCAVNNCTNCSDINFCSTCQNGLVPSTNSSSCV